MRGWVRGTRVRLAGASALLFAVLASGVGVAFWFALRSVDYGDVDTALRTDARDVVSNIHDRPLLDDTPGGIPVGVTILAPGGQVLVSSGPALAPADAVRAANGLGRAGGPRVGDVRSGSVDHRVLVEPVPGAPGLLVVASHPLTELEHDLEAVAVLLTAVVSGLVVLASGLCYWLAGRALRPVGVISGLARDLSEHDLHRRIELSLPADELGELAATFNGMLARLEKAFLALRNFTADAAHELRAPLTLMRAELEGVLKDGQGSDTGRELARALIAETDRLSRLADRLLLLAQADAGKLAPHRAVVDVADLVEETGDRWRPLAAAKGIGLVVRAPDSGSLLGDAELLGRLLDNLLDNAIRSTPHDGRVEIAAAPLASEFRPRLFERFSRVQGARSRESGGAGLGLALCAAIAIAHEGSIRLEDGPGGGARFTVRLPARLAQADPRDGRAASTVLEQGRSAR
jgi:two-component system heavy metal sensor histidine kinase CusS